MVYNIYIYIGLGTIYIDRKYRGPGIVYTVRSTRYFVYGAEYVVCSTWYTKINQPWFPGSPLSWALEPMSSEPVCIPVLNPLEPRPQGRRLPTKPIQTQQALKAEACNMVMVLDSSGSFSVFASHDSALVLFVCVPGDRVKWEAFEDKAVSPSLSVGSVWTNEDLMI